MTVRRHLCACWQKPAALQTSLTPLHITTDIPHHGGKSSSELYAVVGGGCSLGLLLVAGFLLFRWRRRHQRSNHVSKVAFQGSQPRQFRQAGFLSAHAHFNPVYHLSGHSTQSHVSAESKGSVTTPTGDPRVLAVLRHAGYHPAPHSNVVSNRFRPTQVPGSLMSSDRGFVGPLQLPVFRQTSNRRSLRSRDTVIDRRVFKPQRDSRCAPAQVV
jgi:hypothetical protein